MASVYKKVADTVTLSLQKQDGSYSNAVSTENGAVAIGNAMKKFRDGFVQASPDLNIWNQSWTNQGDSFVFRGGNAAGSSYLGISMDPTSPDAEYTLWTKNLFKLPSRFIFSHSQSQRFLGQELELSLNGVVDNTSVIDTMASIADIAISGNITVTTNVATINFDTDHPFKGGDRVILFGNADSRMNFGPVLVTVVTKRQITLPITIANASYTAGGFVRWADVASMAKNSVGILSESATLTTSTYFTRRNGSSARQLPVTTVTVTATQSNTSPYSDAFNAAGVNELVVNMQEATLASKTADNTSSSASTSNRWSQGIPDEEVNYVVKIRAKNLANMTRPIAKIVSIAKTGTTTATVTTDVNHNLSTTSFIQISGVRDITNFPNLAATQVASIVSPTQFTIVIGSAVTASSAGGAVILQQGQAIQAGLTGLAVQAVTRTNNVLIVTVNTTATTALPGEFWHLYGCDATSMGLYDGPYRVLRITGSTYELESTGVDFGSINCGGALFRRTDHRIHFIHELEYTRTVVELANQSGMVDGNRGLPVILSGSSILPTVSAVTSANLGLPVVVADVASAALTTTTSTSAITPTFGAAYKVQVPVTAVTGTTPTLDIGIEESVDTGVNWYRVYDFPRITATGSYMSPTIPMTGNRLRYVQTVGGTTPSFTRAMNRVQSSWTGAERIKQIFDRAVSLTTLNATTGVLYAEGTSNIQLVINIGTATTPPQLTLQASEDNVNWFDVGTALTAVASSTVQLTVPNFSAKFIRARVSTIGATVVTGYTLLKAF